MFILLLDKEAGDPVNLDRTRSAIPEFNLDSLNRDFPVTSQFFGEPEKRYHCGDECLGKLVYFLCH